MSLSLDPRKYTRHMRSLRANFMELSIGNYMTPSVSSSKFCFAINTTFAPYSVFSTYNFPFTVESMLVGGPVNFPSNEFFPFAASVAESQPPLRLRRSCLPCVFSGLGARLRTRTANKPKHNTNTIFFAPRGFVCSGEPCSFARKEI